MSWLTIAGFFVLGLVVGSQVNRAIYAWAWNPRPIGPWLKPHADAPPRRWFDRIPVVGWLTLDRESVIHGSAYWLRPVLIELCFAFGFVGFARWELDGGLFPVAAGLDRPDARLLALTLVPHLVLLALLAIATFIDFDEQYIPDAVTVPGTVFGLIWYATFPQTALPVLVGGPPPQLEPLLTTTPHAWPLWLDGWQGAACGLAILLGWCFALLDKTWTMRRGLDAAFRYCLASLLMPRRSARPAEPRQGRKFRRVFNRRLGLLAAVGSLAVVICYFSLPTAHWRSLLSSLIGLFFGGSLVWAIRIIGKSALGKEAMGFGDVTLLAMIGVYLGWQGALLVLFLAPFAALIVGVAQLIAIREARIAFGPYLCLAAVVLLLKWPWIWIRHGQRMFVMGWLIPEAVAFFLVAMWFALLIWARIKRALFSEA